MYIVIAIIAFGLLVAIHELGHFAAAKICGVRVNEFSVGMGPAIFKKQKGETLYALRVLPLGGYCAMEGEDGRSEDQRSISKKSIPARFFIFAAGPLMNYILGLLIVLILFSQFSAFGSNVVDHFADGFQASGETGLEAGDRITKIDGHRIYYSGDFSMYMDRAGGEPVDMVVIRDGSKIKLDGLLLEKKAYPNDDGTQSARYGVNFTSIPASFIETVKYGFYEAYNFVRMVFMGLSDLITGAVGIREMSGAVGIVGVISQVGASSPSAYAALLNISYIVAFLAVNLAVMNMLPIPALDGGHIFTMLVVWVLEKLLRRKIDPKIETYIHLAGLFILMALMALLVVNDVTKLLGG